MVKGRPSKQLSGAATYKGALRRYWNNRNCGTVINLRFCTCDYFPENYQQLGAAPSKLFASLAADRKRSKYIGFKGRQIISLTMGAQMLRAGDGYDEKES
jgi:hypothetical protein